MIRKFRFIKISRYLITLILLGIGINLLLPQLSTLPNILTVLRGMTFITLLAAVCFQVVSYLGSGYLLKSIVSAGGEKLSILRGILVTLASSSVSLVAGGYLLGTASVYRWIAGSGVSRENALLTGFLPTFLNNFLLIGIAVIGLLHLIIAHKLSLPVLLAFVFTVFVLILLPVIVLWGVNNRKEVLSIGVRLSSHWSSTLNRNHDPQNTKKFIEGVFRNWDYLASGKWKRPLFGALVNIIFDILTLYALFLATGYNINPAVLVIGYGLPLLLGKISFLPGGIGVVEATMATIYKSFGVTDSVTVVVIVVYRLLSFWLPTFVGFVIIPFLQHSSRSGKDLS